MAVVGRSYPWPWLLRTTTRPVALCLNQRDSFVFPSPVQWRKTALLVYRQQQQLGEALDAGLRSWGRHLPRASSGSSGGRGGGEDDGEGGKDGSDGSNEDESGGAIEPEEDGAEGGRGSSEGDGEGYRDRGWRPFWARKKRRESVGDESASAAPGSDGIEDQEAAAGPASGDGGARWQFPWRRNPSRAPDEQEAREEEADLERRRRDGIFVFEVDNESLEVTWRDLLDPTVENVLALVLTAFLVLAIAQILWQLLVVAAAITVSAIKYAILAVFLITILVFLI